MWKLIVTAGLCLTLGSLASSRLVCYYDSTAETREGPSRFMVTDIDPNKCTHLMFAFCNINNQNELAPFTVDDIQRYQAFNGLKNRNPLLKTLLAVGGLTSDTQRFSTVVASQQNRAIFIQSAITFLRTSGFDGLNLDWRHPNGAGSQPQDRHGFTLLIQELKNAFEAEGIASGRNSLIITATVSAERAVIDANYEVEQIAAYLDFINVLTFDLHRSWEGVTRHHSPLYQGSQDTGDSIYSNVHSAMQYWHEMGAPPQKLNLGFGAYGNVYNLASTSNHVGAPVIGLGDRGCNTCADGMWAHYQTCQYLKEVTATMIPDQQVPYATKDYQWVGFDNRVSQDTKISYLQTNEYGGAFVWSLDLDDFSGQFCNEGKFPFISHLHSRLVQDTSGLQMLPAAPAAYPNTPLGPNFCAGKIDGHYAHPTLACCFYSCFKQSSTFGMCQAGLIFKENFQVCVRNDTNLSTLNSAATLRPTHCQENNTALTNAAVPGSTTTAPTPTPTPTTIATTTTTAPTPAPTTTTAPTPTTIATTTTRAPTPAPTTTTAPTPTTTTTTIATTTTTAPTPTTTTIATTTTTAPTPAQTPTTTTIASTTATAPTPTPAPTPTTIASTTPTFAGDPNFCLGKKDGNYAHPTHPSCYYTCVNQSPILKMCLAGLIYIEKLDRCEWNNTNVTLLQNTATFTTLNLSPSTAVTSKEATSAPQYIPDSNFCIGKPDGIYADPNNAKGYYSCVGQITYYQPCPSLLVFIELINRCDHPSVNVTAILARHASTTPTNATANMPATQGNFGDPCQGKTGRVPDPHNPQYFFNCDGNGVYHQACQQGTIFKTSCFCCDHL